MKALQLDKGVLVQLYLMVALLRRIEHIIVDVRGSRADTVHTAYALHQPCRVPRRIVIYNHVGSVQVDTLGQYIGGEDDIISLFIMRGIGIKIVLYHLVKPVAISGRHFQYIHPAKFFSQSVIQII